MREIQVHYVVGFLFSTDCSCGKLCARVALIRKNRPQWQEGLWNGIGGKIEPNEAPGDAMRREFREETGIDFEEWQLFLVGSGKTEVLHFYVGLVKQDHLRTVRTTTDEKVDVFPIDSACSTGTRHFPTVPNLKWELHLALAWLADPSGVFRLTYPT